MCKVTKQTLGEASAMICPVQFFLCYLQNLKKLNPKPKLKNTQTPFILIFFPKQVCTAQYAICKSSVLLLATSMPSPTLFTGVPQLKHNYITKPVRLKREFNLLKTCKFLCRGSIHLTLDCRLQACSRIHCHQIPQLHK